MVKTSERTNHNVVEQLHDFVNFESIFNHVVVRFIFVITPQIAFGVMDVQSFQDCENYLNEFP